MTIVAPAARYGARQQSVTGSFAFTSPVGVEAAATAVHSPLAVKSETRTPETSATTRHVTGRGEDCDDPEQSESAE